MLDGGVDGILGEVSPEVDGTAESEDVKVVLLSSGALVEHGGSKTGRGVDAVIAINGSSPAVDTRVLISVETEGAAIERCEVVLESSLDGDFIVILQVGTDTGKVRDNGDVELLQLISRSDTAKLENLGSVVNTTGDDNLTRSSGVARGTSSTGSKRAGLVEMLAVKELNAIGTRGLGVIESDLGDVAVGSDIEGIPRFIILPRTVTSSQASPNMSSSIPSVASYTSAIVSLATFRLPSAS